MIPIRDENPTRTVPWVNYMLILANVVFWGWQILSELSGIHFISAAYGVVPRRLLADPMGEAFTIFMAMFLHGGWAHVGGNMLFLYIFGDNVEDALGHGRYLAFYLVGGVVATAAQVAIDPQSIVPMIGASGAIAGVLGGYLVLYPRAPITVVNPVFPLWFILGPLLVFPAWLVMGEWFVWNLIPGVASIGQGGSGVAFFAHIGGFLAGLVLVRPLGSGRSRHDSRAWSGWRPPPRSSGGPTRPTWSAPSRRRMRNFYD
jgi:membrane associated rhomboid family serine protease